MNNKNINLKKHISINNDVDYTVIGGWMIVFTISIVISVLLSLYNGFAGLTIYLYNSSEAILIVVLKAVSVLLSVVILSIMRFRSYKILYLIRFLYISYIFLNIVSVTVYNGIYGDNMLVLTYAGVAWAVYLFKSRRVKHYYYRLESVKTNDEITLP